MGGYLKSQFSMDAKAFSPIAGIGSLGSAAIPGYFAIQMRLAHKELRAEVTGVFQAATALAGIIGPMMFNEALVQFLSSGEILTYNPFALAFALQATCLAILLA